MGLTIMISVPSDVGSVVVHEDDKFRNDEYDERCDTQEVDDQAEVDEEPRGGIFAQPFIGHDECAEALVRRGMGELRWLSSVVCGCDTGGKL